MTDKPMQFLTPEGTLVDAEERTLKADRALRVYRDMVRARRIDERMEKLQRQGRVGFHVGALGEEAAIVASAAALRETDMLFPCYREIGALLARGFPLQRYLDNMFGNADDVVRGRQMPDHYTAKDFHYASVSSPVGTQITQATGYAWAAKLQKDPQVVGVYFGEGATSSNDFHAGMNLAGVLRLPVVFLCRNNHWAISVSQSQQTASDTFAEKAKAYGMPGVRCDGADAFAVYESVSAAAERAREGEGPTMVELVAHRLGGHSTSDNPKAYLAEEVYEEAKRGDPVLRLMRYLVAQGLWDDDQERAFLEGIDAELQACIEAAEAKPKPSLETMFEDVYEHQPWHLAAQQASLLSLHGEETGSAQERQRRVADGPSAGGEPRATSKPPPDLSCEQGGAK